MIENINIHFNSDTVVSSFPSNTNYMKLILVRIIQKIAVVQ